MRYLISILIFSLAVLTSCGQSGGNAPGEATLPSTTPVTTVPPSPPPSDGTSSFALVYGSTASDRTLLDSRIAGYQAPGLSEVFNNWKRIAGNSIFNSASDITQTPAYCFTGFDSNNNWLNGTNPSNGSSITPGTFNNCVNSNDFVSASWSYKSTGDQLYNAANGTSFNGFISGIKFVNYNLQAVVSSANTDDDGIGLIIAAFIDSSNVIHTLTALRTQGGIGGPTLGWGVVYRQNNNVISIIGNKSVGGVNTNGSQGDRLGWNDRKTLIRVERSGDSIKAYASVWGTNPDTLTVDPASEISIDLSNVANGLTGFQGEQHYGYGTISQLGANFSKIAFSTPNAETDPSYIYDLFKNTVYVKMIGGGYTLVNGMEAYTSLGFPLRVKNTETSKEFRIDSATSYTEL